MCSRHVQRAPISQHWYLFAGEPSRSGFVQAVQGLSLGVVFTGLSILGYQASTLFAHQPCLTHHLQTPASKTIKIPYKMVMHQSFAPQAKLRMCLLMWWRKRLESGVSNMLLGRALGMTNADDPTVPNCTQVVHGIPVHCCCCGAGMTTCPHLALQRI